MVRWEPGARERLQAAAIELFAERGYEQTTAADVAESVGLTERTFFRHFADKREVLFDGQDRFQQTFLNGVAHAPEGSTAVELARHALDEVGAFFPDERRGYSRQRQAIILANPPLQERELFKLTRLATDLAEAFRSRGVGEPQATLGAQSTLTVFSVSFRQWLADGEERSFATIAHEVLDALRSLAAS